MLEQKDEGSREKKDAHASHRQSTFSEHALIRIIGALVGLVSFFLPWGSIIVRDDIFATASVTSVGMADLVTSSFAVVAIASILFVLATFLALIDGRAVIGQIVALVGLLMTIPDLLASMAAALPPLPPGWSVSTSIASGFYLGLLSAAIQVISFLPRRREARREAQGGLIGSERLRPEENPYHGAERKGPFHR